jgi:hypothetical protein
MDFNLEIAGYEDQAISEILEIANPDPMSYNAPGEPRRIDIKSRKPASSRYLEVSPYSVTLVKINLQ